METTSQTNRSYASRFIERLGDLEPGQRAVLRRNAGRSLAESRNAIGIFYRLLPMERDNYHEEVYFLISTLYPLNDKTPVGDTLGHALAKVRSSTGSEALDRRMAILLDSEFVRFEGRLRPGELGFRLRQIVKLLASHDVGVNWENLLIDLLQWTHPDHWVQKKWARAYFGSVDFNQTGNS